MMIRNLHYGILRIISHNNNFTSHYIFLRNIDVCN